MAIIVVNSLPMNDELSHKFLTYLHLLALISYNTYIYTLVMSSLGNIEVYKMTKCRDLERVRDGWTWT